MASKTNMGLVYIRSASIGFGKSNKDKLEIDTESFMAQHWMNNTYFKFLPIEILDEIWRLVHKRLLTMRVIHLAWGEHWQNVEARKYTRATMIGHVLKRGVPLPLVHSIRYGLEKILGENLWSTRIYRKTMTDCIIQNLCNEVAGGEPEDGWDPTNSLDISLALRPRAKGTELHVPELVTICGLHKELVVKILSRLSHPVIRYHAMRIRQLLCELSSLRKCKTEKERHACPVKLGKDGIIVWDESGDSKVMNGDEFCSHCRHIGITISSQLLGGGFACESNLTRKELVQLYYTGDINRKIGGMPVAYHTA